MDIHQLRVFAAVFKNRSFSKASEDLHLTQPTVSDHIKELEGEFGCRLFDRLGRTIIPTREAEVLHRHAVEIIEKAEALKEVLGRFKKEVSGELVIGASTIPGTYVLPALLAEFKKSYPSISFQIVVSDSRGIVEKVTKHEVLLGIVGAKLATQQLTYLPFRDDELIVIAPPSVQKSGVITLRDLSKMPLVLREEGSGTRREVERILEDNGLSLEGMNIAGIFGSTDAVKQAVKEGLGVSIVSRVSVRDELAHGILQELKLKNLKMKRTFYIVTHKKRSLPVAYRMFLEHLKG